MRLKAIGTAAAALTLALPGIAHAAKTVEVGGGACQSDDVCGSLADAANGAADGDTIVVRPKSGGWQESVTFGQGGLTVKADGSGEVVIRGTLTFTGEAGPEAQAFAIEGLTVLATSGSALRFTTSGAAADKTVAIRSSILSGEGSGSAAVSASTESLSVGDIAIEARHVTISDRPGGGAVAYSASDQGTGSIAATFHDSIVKGSAISGTNNDPTPDSTLFVDPSNENFHLRVTSPAIDAGGTGAANTFKTDVDGEARQAPWDRGADEVHHDPPSKPSLTASPTSVQTGTPVSFTASASDPDAHLGDAVTYRWAFGDGTTGAGASTSHAYATAGEYVVRVTAVDATNRTTVSDPVTITVTNPPPTGGTGTGTDGGKLTSITQLPGFEAGAEPARRGPDTEAPAIAFAFPRPNQTVRLGRSRALLRGRNADQSGVRRVELALMRREGSRCRWYDGRASFRLGRCTEAVFFKVTVDDYDWYFALPRNVRPRPGAYSAFVRATDYLGNRTTAFTAANAVSFRWAR